MEELLQTVDQRIALYAFVSRLMLKEVDVDFLKKMEGDETLMQFMPHYRDWQKRKVHTMEELIERYYNVDFANLFILHIVPYESFYMREDQMIESGGDNPVLELYNALDFRVKLAEARVVSPDHIGVELEFLYMLNAALKKALEAKDEIGVCELLQVQHGFMKDHLLQWAPMFLINVKRESRTPLYHDGAEMTLEFILSDFEYVTKMRAALCDDTAEKEEVDG